MTNNNIQQLIDSGNGTVILPPGEFKGPFYVDHPCTIQGSGTTLWNSSDFVLAVTSPDVVLKDLRIEMIDSGEERYSLCVLHDIQTENIEIIGPTAGLKEEDTVPEMNKKIKLGSFGADSENTFIAEFFSPSDAVLETNMHDIKLDPAVLTSGINRVKITTATLPSGTFIYGDIIMRSSLNRRFYVQGIASDKAEKAADKLIAVIDNEETERLKDALSRNAEFLKTVKRTEKPQIKQERTNDVLPGRNPVSDGSDNRQSEKKITGESGVHNLSRGERVSIDGFTSSPLRIYMSYRALFKQIDIDPYAFMLDSTGVTSCDDDFVFFGNRETQSGAITFMDDNSIELDLSKVPEHIKKISFVYSIYQPGPNDNFSKVMEPFVAVVQNGREIFRYTASELFAETTIIFIEIYKHNTGWKLNTVGQGYRDGLKRLCASYGLIVS